MMIRIVIEIPDEYKKIIEDFEAKSGRKFEEFAKNSIINVLKVLPKLKGITKEK